MSSSSGLPPPTFIVVGAGPAGCALAAALAQGQEGRVVLVELGPDNRDHSKVDHAHDWVKAAFSSGNSQLYWSVPHKHLGGRLFLTPRGKGPGGTGLVNAMQYSRGYPADYASWPWPLEEIERSYEHVEAKLRAAGALTEGDTTLVGLAFEKAAAAIGLRVISPEAATGGGGGGGKGATEPTTTTTTSSSNSSNCSSGGNEGKGESAPPTATASSSPSSSAAAPSAQRDAPSSLSSSSSSSPSPYYLLPESYAPMRYVARRRRQQEQQEEEEQRQRQQQQQQGGGGKQGGGGGGKQQQQRQQQGGGGKQAGGGEGVEYNPKQKLIRVSPFEAFIQPLLDAGQPNLSVLFNARTTRIIFDGHRRAVGIQYVDRRTRETRELRLAAEDGAEVILSAGAIESPKLLLLSGVGDPAHLTPLGIRTVAPLPAVGKGLKDHLLAPLACFSRINMSQRTDAGEGMRAANAMYGWVNVIRKAGSSSSNSSSNSSSSGGGGGGGGGGGDEMRISIMTSDYSMSPDLIPEIALPRYPGLLWGLAHFAVSTTLRLLLLMPCMRWVARQVVGCLVCVMNPKSQGAVKLRSRDPLDPPIVDPAYLSDQRDVAALHEGLHLARQLVGTEPLQPILGIEVLPGPAFSYNCTLQFTSRFASLYAGSYYHPACSCRMGQVVDSRLRVQGGVSGLRVADASILPDLGSAGPVGSCFMIGDRCARLVLEDLAREAAVAAEKKRRRNGTEIGRVD